MCEIVVIILIDMINLFNLPHPSFHSLPFLHFFYFSVLLVMVIFSFFTLEPVDSVVDCEYVLWVESLLHVLDEINGHWWHNFAHKPFPDLTDPMMMRKRATLLQAFFSALVLNLFIYLDHLIARDARVSVVVPEVNIDGRTSLIELSYSEGSEQSIFFNAALFTSPNQSLADFAA